MILALTFGFMLLLVLQKGYEAVAGATYPVYNVTQRVYASDLQAALDGARPGDFIQVVAQNASFITSLNWQVEGVTLDLNGAVITAPSGKNAISVAGTVYSLTLQNGTLKTSGINDNGIEVTSAGNTCLELRLENMVIDGAKAVYFKRNGRLEWSGGRSGSLDHGVRVEYGVNDFSGVFRDVTFTRSSRGAIYFSGLRQNNPVTRFDLANCRLGEDNNPLAGPALWIEAGMTEINIQGCTLTAGGNGSDFIHINASGTVSISDSSFQCLSRTAVYTQGVNSLILTRNRIVTRHGFESPAIKVISPSTVQVEGNTMMGPGPLGIMVVGGRVILQQNQLQGFTAGIDLQKGDAMDMLVTALENTVTVDGTAFTLNSALEGNLQGNELKGDIALQLLSSQGVQVENNFLQGSSAALLVSSSQGVTVRGNTFTYNATGISVLNSRNVSINACDLSCRSGDTAGTDITGLLIDNGSGVSVTKSTFSRNSTGVIVTGSSAVTLRESSWKNNGTGLRLAGRVEGEVTGNTITANAVGLDLLQVTEPNLRFIGNNIYNNEQGLLASPGNNLAVLENYWGSSSGPYHAALNPQGHGDKITGDLSFTPWAPYAYYEDDTPPQVSLALPGEMWLTDEPVPLQVSLAEEKWLDRVMLGVYGPGGETVMAKSWWRDEWPPSSASLSWEPDTKDKDGVYRFTVLAIDGKGNQGEAGDYLILDRQPPTVLQVCINNEAEETSSLTVELTLRAADANGIDAMMITNEGGPPGEWESYRETRSWQLLPGPPGSRQVIVHFRDGAGRESVTTASIIFKPLRESSGSDSESSGGPGQDPGGGSSEEPESIKPPAENTTWRGSKGSQDSPEKNSEDMSGVESEEPSKEQVPVRVPQGVAEFVDVPPEHWAWPAIMALAGEGLLRGDGEGRFYPDAPLSRAEMAALLDRMLDITPDTPRVKWVDIPPDSWYASAVARATGAGLMEGYTGGTFRPLQGVSREQAVIILARAAEWLLSSKIKAPPTWQAVDPLPHILPSFPDESDISPPAQRAVLWAVKEGLLRGYPDGTLRPLAPMTRGEAAVLMERFRMKFRQIIIPAATGT
ncbi:S-layer homology domain-containing protein [Neomoorella mulderi]|uniref:S-layer homology domain-containing protein n=1 Tax=Neomoorella mulderi TaxID=202604 RepID=UPI0007837C5B|nr:S-layer homology domain-containing protein [Moorella mulderi]